MHVSYVVTNDIFNQIYNMDIYILDGLLICLSESGLMQAMLLNHNLARLHISFIHNNLRDSQIFVLQVRYFNSYSYLTENFIHI